jgi:aryl-alcohol dehydrogenase-like predicted oxidoreductase
LGTAQLGLKYGVANRSGKPSEEEAFGILQVALAEGVDMLDTAYVYGDSEAVIGRFCSGRTTSFKVVSKLPDLDRCGMTADECLNETLRRTGRSGLYGYLVHEFNNIRAMPGIVEKFEKLKTAGKIEKMGFSLYRTEELEYLLGKGIKFDILQVPYNVFDQRFAGFFPALKRMGVEIHTRSAFLQGLFFLDAEYIGERFGRLKNGVEELRGMAGKEGLAIAALCLAFPLLNDHVDKVVIGVDTASQLKEDLGLLRDVEKARPMRESLASLRIDDEEVILPCNWK